MSAKRKDALRRAGKALPHVIPPPGRAFPRAEHKPWVVTSFFIGVVDILKDMPDARVVGFVLVGGEKQVFRLSLPRSDAAIVRFLNQPYKKSKISTGYRYLATDGPYQLSGVWVGVDTAASHQMASIGAAEIPVLGNAALTPLSFGEDVLFEEEPLDPHE
jgi:hypothetical protein